MGRRHAVGARELGHDVVVFDAADAARRRAQADGFSCSESWPFGADAMIIATPASDHVGRVGAAAPDVPILVEKPLAMRSTDVLAPRQQTYVAYNWRFHPAVDVVRSVAEPLVGLELFVTTDMRNWPGSHYADALLECSHEVDLALALAGPAYLVDAAHVGGSWILDLRHGRGCETRILIDGCAASEKRGLRFQTASYDGGYDVPPTDSRSVAALAESYQLELAEFLDAAAGRRRTAPRLATLADGLAVLRILDAARAAVGVD